MKKRTQLFGGYVLVFALMIVLAVLTYRGFTSLIESANWVEHTQEVIGKARLIEKLVSDMETGQRGFLIAGTEEFLEPYNDGSKSYEIVITDFKELVSDNPAQVKRIREIEILVAKWQETAAIPEIAARRRVNVGQATEKQVADLIRNQTGKSIIDALRARFAKFLEAEEELLVDRHEVTEAAAIRNIFIFGTLIGLLFVATVFSAVLHVRRTRAETARRKAQLELQAVNTSMAFENWLKTGLVRLNEVTAGGLDVTDLADKTISEISRFLEIQLGAIYIAANDDGAALSLMGSYAFKQNKVLSQVFKPGEGLVGQAAQQRKQILVNSVPEDYIKVTSGLGELTPRVICVTPFLLEGRVKGVVELGTLSELSKHQMEYLAQAMSILAIAVEAAQSRMKMAELLEDSQQLSEEFQAQQEELKVANEELVEKTAMLERQKSSGADKTQV